MNALSRPAKLYIGITLGVAVAVGAWNLTRLKPEDAWLLLAVSALAAAVQVFKVEGATGSTSYTISWMAYGFALVRLGPPAAMFVILAAHVVEWIFHSYRWYVQTFNIATYLLAAQAAQLCLGPVSSNPSSLTFFGVVALVAALAVFTGVNHLLIGLVIWLARGENLSTSGVFGQLTLMIDFSLLCLGTAAAMAWAVNPFAVILAIFPLYIVYSTLRVPALERQTARDPKTGLYNARYLREALEKELAKARRLERPLTVVMADLDLLRNINNTYGHLAGDTVLNGMAEILQRSVRSYDIVARFGGEEFVIVMPEIEPEDAVARVEVIRRAIEARAFEVTTNVEPIRATMSFGIAGCEQSDQTKDQILHNADLAVLFSKLNGRNVVSLNRLGQSRLMPGAALIPGEAVPAVQPEAAPGSKIGLPENAPRPAPPAVAVPASETAPRASSEPEPTPNPDAERALPAAKPAVTARPAPPWFVNTYIAGLAVIAIALALALAAHWPWLQTGPDWIGLAIFGTLAFLSEWLAVDIYVRDTSVSLATVSLVGGTLLFPPLGAVTVSLVLALTAKVKHQSATRNFIFNLSNHLIGSLGCLAVLVLAGASLPVTPPVHLPGLQFIVRFIIQLILVTLSAGVIFISTTMFLALVIRLDTGQPFRPIWLERFAWLWPYYLGMGAMAYTLMYSYAAVGPIGVAAVILPLAVLRYSQELYVNRTTTMVKQLRGANDTLLKQAREVATLNEELLTALAHAIDLRDPDVLGHSQNVARYAILIAQELGLPPEEVELVRKGGLLHDIGKLGIPEALLFKPGSLTNAEYAQIKEHSALGASIIADCHSLYKLVTIVRHHHERFDGRGYPDHLWAQNIPLEARILAVADAVEAMASDRPYRRAMDARAILEEVQSQAGVQFDPEVVAAFSNAVSNSATPVIVNSARSAETPLTAAAAAVRPEKPVQYNRNTTPA